MFKSVKEQDVLNWESIMYKSIELFETKCYLCNT